MKMLICKQKETASGGEVPDAVSFVVKRVLMIAERMFYANPNRNQKTCQTH